LQWIETPESQGFATVFVAKFFGRAGLMSFISAVPDTQRPALFQSLLFEAAGRTVNPVNGAVGLLWSGNWHVCQAAVETVLRGGALRPIPEFLSANSTLPDLDEASDCTEMLKLRDPCISGSRSKPEKRRRLSDQQQFTDLDLSLARGFPAKILAEKRREETPSRNSEESVMTTTTMTTCFDSGFAFGGEPKLLNLF
jgi:hypothetical protein